MDCDIVSGIETVWVSVHEHSNKVFVVACSDRPRTKPFRDAVIDALVELHADRLRHYQQDAEAAERLLSIGESPVTSGLDRAGLAALADVCHTILNLSETLTRN